MANTILTKQDKPKILNYFPTKQYGQEGDIVISKIKGKGIFFCIKASGAWYAQTTMQPLNKINDVFIKHLKSEKITLKNIKESEITAEKFLISSNGNIRYRTADGILNDLGLGNLNSFDIAYKTAYCSLEQYSDKETCKANGGTWYYSENDSHDNISSTAENELLTVSQSIGKVDAESTLTYDGSVLQIKKNSDYDDNWQSSVQESQIRFNDGTYHTGFKTHGTMTADSLYTLPPAYPSGNKILQSDTSGNLTWVTDSTVAALTTEEVQDIAGGMFTGNTETRISATYEDGDGTIDLVVDAAAVTALNSATENELVTVGATTTELDAESTLTYTANNLLVNNADSRIGADISSSDHGFDLDVHAGNANGTSKNGGDLYLNAGRATGNGIPGYIYFTTSIPSAASNTTLRAEATVGTLSEQGLFTLTDSDGTAGHFKALDTGTSVNCQMTDIGLIASGDLSLDASGGCITLDDDGTTFGEFESSGSVFKLYENGGASTADYFKIACAANGATTISTVDAFSTGANLTIDPDGYLELNAGGLAPAIRCENPLKIREDADAVGDTAGYGQIWVHDTTPNILMFTNDIGTDYEIGPAPGTILGYTCIGADVADDSYTLTASYVCFPDSGATEISVTFVTPPSENVEIEVELYFSAGSAASDLELSLSNNATYGSNSLSHPQQFEKSVREPARGHSGTVTQKWFIGDGNLAAIGSLNQLFIAAKADSTSGTPIIRWGGDVTGEYTNLVMKAVALPGTIVTGS